MSRFVFHAGHARVEIGGLALRLVVAVRETLVEDESVENHVHAVRRLRRELDREHAQSVALLVVVLVQSLEHRLVFERLALCEILRIAAEDRNGLVDEEPVLLHLARVDTLGEMDRVAVRGLFKRLPEVLERSLLRAGVLVLARIERDIDVSRACGQGRSGKRRGNHELVHVCYSLLATFLDCFFFHTRKTSAPAATSSRTASTGR